jgi:hypothetical protein
MTIYRTPDGYAMTKIGRSDVYHVPNTCQVPAHGRPMIADDLDEDHRPCPKCKPASREDIAPYTLVQAELDVPAVFYALTTPEELIDACRMIDPAAGGQTYIPNLARQVLSKAAKEDPLLGQVWRSGRQHEAAEVS